MELDKTILEKICYDEHNGSVPVKLIHYDVIIDSTRIDWIVKCVYSVPMNVNGVVKEGWSYNATQFVNKLQYEKEKTRLIREKKLNELGI
jgi:hypothetical protein